MFKFKNKTIIAMKGPPFHRKTDFATHIAASLSCPVLSLADFLHSMSPDCLSSCKPQPQDLAFEIICQIVKTNFSKGFVESIVIDSPLSSRSHLDQLIQLAESIGQTRLVTVECRTDNIYQLQSDFDEFKINRYLGFQFDYTFLDEDSRRIYQSICNNLAKETRWETRWEEIEKAIRDAYDERCDGYKVPKLVLDPLLDYEAYDDRHRRTPPFIDAVSYMINRNEGDGPDLVVYNLWRRGHYLAKPGGIEARKQSGACKAGSGHYITQYAEEGLGYEASCIACENQVLGAAYSCECCSFALHEECAELLDENNNRLGRHPPENLDFLSYRGCRYVYPELEFRCSSCKENGTLSDSCGDCLFTTHLKSRFLPTVIWDDCDEHFLSIGLSDLNPYENRSKCRACGGSIESVWYSCKSCHVSYHYQCLTEVIPRVEHEHGGHHHHMLLQYSSKELEEYLCDVCFERECPDKRDPSLWYYSCEECPYVAHLGCVNDGKTYSDSWFMRTRPLENLQKLIYPEKNEL